MRTTAPALLVCAALLAAPAFAAKPAKKPVATKKAAEPKAAPDVVTDVPPPSGTWEAKPPPAEGYVWSQGFYTWKKDHYEWQKGDWVLARPGLEYRQHQWVQRGDGKWHLVGGDWVEPGTHHAANGK